MDYTYPESWMKSEKDYLNVVTNSDSVVMWSHKSLWEYR